MAAHLVDAHGCSVVPSRGRPRAAPAGRGRLTSACSLLVLVVTLGLHPPAAADTELGPTTSRQPAPVLTTLEEPERRPAVTPSPTRAPTPTPTPTRTRGSTRPSPTQAPSTAPSSTTTPTSPERPPLVGLTVAQARRALRGSGSSVAALEGLADDATVTQQLGDGESLVVAVTGGSVEAAPPVAEPVRPLDQEALAAAAAAPGIDALLEQCEALDRDFEPAGLVFDRELEMRVGRATAVPVEVTLDRAAGPQVVGGLTRVPVRVTCEVKARLVGAKLDFSVEPEDWQTESLRTRPTAQWSWLVTPQRTGTATLVLEMTPVLRIDQPGPDPTSGSASRDGSTHDEFLTVHVTAPWYESLAVWLDRLGALLTSAKGAVVALTALLVAVVALAALVRKRRAGTPDALDGDR